MTTYYPFSPNPRQVPTFTPTLDGNQYTITVPWNFSSKRFYVQCVDLNGNLIFNVPLLESQVANPISDLFFDSSTSRAVVLTKNSLDMPIGRLFNVTVFGNSPPGYNGSGLAVVCTDYKFVYNLATNPGTATVLGSAEIIYSICQGYFNSTLVYRNGQFEVNP